MRDDFLNFAEKKVVRDYPSTTTTLIIDKVPSEVAYEILTNCLMREGDFSRENLQQKIKERIVGDGISVSYPEITKERFFRTAVPQGHTYGPVQVDENGTLYRQCECGHRINVPIDEANIGEQIRSDDHKTVQSIEASGSSESSNVYDDDFATGIDEMTAPMIDEEKDEFGYDGGSEDITPHRL